MNWHPVVDRSGLARRWLLASLMLVLAPAAGAQVPPGSSSASTAPTVARVNGKPILRRDFDMAVQMAFRQRGVGERRHQDLKAARDAVLETLIDNEILHQKAVQAGMTVSDAEVREEVSRLKESLGGAGDAADFLKQNGVTEKDLNDQVRRSLLVRRFVERQLGSPPAIGESEVRAFYDANPAQFQRPEAIHISQIVVHVASNATAAARAEARSKAEAILLELRGGKDFAELARLHSDGPGAKQGGDSGWVWPGSGALPSVERMALSLKRGQTSDVVESRRGFHIIKAVDRRPAGAVPFEEARERIIDRLAAERRRDQVRSYAAELRKTARIERVP